MRRFISALTTAVALTAGCVSGFASPARAADAITVTDLAGREVTITQPVERLIVSEGRYVELLALLRPDAPVEGLVGMMSPIGDAVPGLEAALIERFPETAEIPRFGLRSAQTLSAEKIVSLAPQLAIFGLQDHGPGKDSAELIAQLEASGTAVVFIDFRINPLENTTKSVALIGEILGAEAQAQAFNGRVEALRARIAETVAQADSRPRVFFQAHVGRFDCCVGFADGMLGPYVGVAGGENLADASAPGPVGRHTQEFLLVENPDVLIGTASGSAKDYAEGLPFLALGAGVDAAMAQASIAKGFGDETFQALDAVSGGHAHGLWHGFYNSPFNIVALEALAAWIHPELFPDADPQESFDALYRDFIGFEIPGERFVTLAR